MFNLTLHLILLVYARSLVAVASCARLSLSEIREPAFQWTATKGGEMLRHRRGPFGFHARLLKPWQYSRNRISRASSIGFSPSSHRRPLAADCVTAYERAPTPSTTVFVLVEEYLNRKSARGHVNAVVVDSHGS